MSEFALKIHVRQGNDNGPAIAGATVLIETVPATTGGDGVATVQDFFLTVQAPGFKSFVKQIFRRPSMEGEIPVSLQPGADPTPEPTPAPTPVPTPVPIRDEGPPGPAELTAEYVGKVKKWLQDRGTNLKGACGAFAITKRVAWELRDTGAGTLHKPSGNNCEERATDIIVFKDGRAFDILFDGGETNGPLFNPTDVDDVAGRWRAPVKP